MSKPTFFLFAVLLCFISCKKTEAPASNYTYQMVAIKKSYLSISGILIEDYKAEAQLFTDYIAGFSTLPILARFENSKTGWVNTKSAFLRLAPLLHADHLQQPSIESFLDQNNHDINIGFIDSTENQPNAGIVKNETDYPNLDYGALTQIQDTTTGNNRLLGFKPLEFMLFGEDKSFSDPGTRTHYEFSLGEFGERRRDLIRGMGTYINVKSAQLNIDQELEMFERMNPQLAFESVLNGLIQFIDVELIEQSLQNPLTQAKNGNGISEESVFSDATTQHLIQMLAGIEGILDGRPYHNINSGYFLIDFIREVDELKSNKVISSLDDVAKVLNGFNVDFDKALDDAQYHSSIQRIIDRLTDLSQTLTEFKVEVLD